MFAAFSGVVSCKSPEAAKSSPPATKTVTESDLSRITLTADAVSRLGIALADVERCPAPRQRTVAGDVMPSSGRSIALVAPLAGRIDKIGAELRLGQVVHRGDALLTLTPVASVDRDLKATAERTIRSAESRLTAMEARLARADKLLADGAGSLRAAEEARADRDTARAELDAAKARGQMVDHAPLAADVATTLRAPEDGVIRAMNAPLQTMVPPGTVLLEIVGTGALWVRASVFVGDLRSIRPEASAQVRPLTASVVQSSIEALPVLGPPTGDPALATADLYYSIAANSPFRPGERVAISLVQVGEKEALMVPTSAIVRDVAGSAWVYESLASNVFERRRVEVDFVDKRSAFLSRGVHVGAKIVTTGSVELFGFEFGNGK